jgi:hypothetical protein
MYVRNNFNMNENDIKLYLKQEVIAGRSKPYNEKLLKFLSRQVLPG